MLSHGITLNSETALYNTEIQSYLREPDINETKAARDIVAACMNPPDTIKPVKFAKIYQYFSSRYWAVLEDRRLYDAIIREANQPPYLQALLTLILEKSPHLVAVTNALRLSVYFEFALSNDILRHFVNHNMLASPAFEILFRSGAAPAEKQSFAVEALPLLRGWHILHALKFLPETLPHNLQETVLCLSADEATPFQYTPSEKIDTFLYILRRGNVTEVLKRGRPSDKVIKHLLRSYAYFMDELLFEDHDDVSQALEAFPVFINHLRTTKLDLNDCHELIDLHSTLSDDVEADLSNPEFSNYTNTIASTVPVIEAIAQRPEIKRYVGELINGKDKFRCKYAVRFALHVYNRDNFDYYDDALKHRDNYH